MELERGPWAGLIHSLKRGTKKSARLGALRDLVGSVVRELKRDYFKAGAGHSYVGDDLGRVSFPRLGD